MNTGEDHRVQQAEPTGQGGAAAEQTGQEPEQVSLVYRLTLDDIRGAVRARARRTSAGRAETLLLPLLSVAAVVGLCLLQGTLSIVTAVSAAVALVVATCGVFSIRRSMARQVYSVVEQYGECRTVAGEQGTATTGETMSYTMDWKLFPQYTETPELFVLVGGTRAAAIGVLPKRGAQHPADIDRLRAILDRNLRRV
ncbi:YcxB family protein [Streptomyces sp. NPDC020858]|uniref:YcxB family protein n=1 Tax=Streptomyces sp. NPDC020858 TaxID=3365097 RepID=UPI0037879356